jgi:hypothetical protein
MAETVAAVALEGTVDAAQPSGARVAPGRDPVPWRHQSAASRLIDRIAVSDRAVLATVQGLMRPLAERLHRKGAHSPARKEDLIDLERAWRTNPTLAGESRLAYAADFTAKRKGLVINDCRISTTSMTLHRWPLPEHGLAIILTRLSVVPGDVGLTIEVPALLSAHAIGRRYERGYGDDTAVIGDFQRLAAALVTDSKATQCECPSGVWVGDAMVAFGRNTLAIKTFLPSINVSWTN